MNENNQSQTKIGATLRYGTDGFWLITEKILRILNGLIVTAAIARYVGPESYGILSLALGTVLIFSAAASMGSEDINVAELARREKFEQWRYMLSALVIRVVWGLICLFMFCLYMLISSEQEFLLWVLALLIPLGAFSMLGSKLHADGEFRRYAILSSISVMVGALIKVTSIYLELPLIYFAGAICLDAVSLILLQLFAVFGRTNKSLANEYFSFDNALEYFRLCLPTALSAIFVAIYFRLELFVVNAELGNVETGLWAAILLFLTPWSMVSSAILPIVNRQLVKQGLADVNYEKNLVKLIRIMLAIAVGAIFLNILASVTVIPLLLGEKFARTTTSIWIVSFALIPMFLGSVQEIWIAHQRTTGTVLKKVLIGIPLSYVFLQVFISIWGFTGAAVALLCSYTSTAILMNTIFDRPFLKLTLRALGFAHG